MKKIFITAGLVSILTLPALAQNADVVISDGGTSTDTLALTFNSTSGTWDLNTPTQVSFTNGPSIDLTTFVVDPDPSVRFAFGVNNPELPLGTTSSTPYTFTFTTNVNLPAPGPYSASSSLGVTLTKGADLDASGNDVYDSNPVWLTPPSGGAVMTSSIGTTNVSSVNQVTSQLTAYPPSGTPGVYSQTFSQPTLNNPSVYIGTTATQLSVTTSFTLSNSDSASLSGTFSVSTPTAAPEPATWGLGLLCAGTFAVLALRRRRTAKSSFVSGSPA